MLPIRPHRNRTARHSQQRNSFDKVRSTSGSALGAGSIELRFGVAIAANVGWILFGVVLVATIISGFAIAVKRLHDRDKSGWWVLLFYVAPNVASAIGTASGDSGLLAVAGLVNLAISIWAFVEMGCLRGTAGTNRYGPDPLSG
jgi:uncharacterized membrane protein YhaH (DUF805 family)